MYKFGRQIHILCMLVNKVLPSHLIVASVVSVHASCVAFL